MSVIGYARVSTREQQPASQVDRLRAAGAQRVFVDHGQSSRQSDRPQWGACLDYLRAGDELLITSLTEWPGPNAWPSKSFESLPRKTFDCAA